MSLLKGHSLEHRDGEGAFPVSLHCHLLQETCIPASGKTQGWCCGQFLVGLVAWQELFSSHTVGCSQGVSCSVSYIMVFALVFPQRWLCISGEICLCLCAVFTAST